MKAYVLVTYMIIHKKIYINLDCPSFWGTFSVAYFQIQRNVIGPIFLLIYIWIQIESPTCFMNLKFMYKKADMAINR